MAKSFIKIAKGAKVKGLKANDNVMQGDGDFINNEGKLENAELNRNIHIVPTKIKKITLAIKNPGANDNQGWKIMIVGCVLAFILGISGMAIYDFIVKPKLSSNIVDSNNTNEPE